MTNSWTFKNENYEELRKSILPEDSNQFSIMYFGSNNSTKIIRECLELYCEGIRTYLVKDPPFTEANVKKQDR